MIRGILIGAIVAILAWLSWQAYDLRQQYVKYQEVKQDYAFITKIDYGLFDIKSWRDQAFDVFTEQIQEFEISSSAYREVEKELEKYLRSVYKDYIASGKIFDNIFADAEKSEKVNKFLLKLLKDNVGTQIEALNIPKYIPGMSVQLAQELKKNEPRIKEVMQQELVKLMTFDDRYPQVDPRQTIFDKYQAPDLNTTKAHLSERLSQQAAANQSRITYLFVGIVLLVLLSLSLYKVIGFNNAIGLVSLISILLLACGISMPMMNIDARLNSFVFNLFETDIGFEEQTVFYQSKSIMDVTKTLIEGRTIDLKLVGVLIFLFSIAFPLIKLLLSAFFLYSRRLQASKVAQGLIFHLGKWSMADVFVVAMFMSYIGFYGLVVAQLEQIERNKGGFAVETVNYSELAPGALFFTTYCIVSILLGVLVNRHYRNHML